MSIERGPLGASWQWVGAVALLSGAMAAPATAQSTKRLFAGDGSSRAKAPVNPARAHENPYGLQDSLQTIDKDQIAAYVTQVAGYRPDERIEESEVEDLIDDFEKTYGVYVEDRDLLLVSGLNARGLVNALQSTLNDSVSNNVKPNRLTPANLPRQKHQVPKFESDKLPGLTNDPTNEPEETPYGRAPRQSEIQSQNRQLDNKIDYYSSGSQKDYGRTKKGFSKQSSSYHNRTFASSYQEVAKRREEARKNRFIPDDVQDQGVAERDAKAKEFYSNGLSRYDADGNELYANGRRKISDMGVALYSNGRPKVDSAGNLLHSNGQRKTTNDGRKLYANGRPMLTNDGVLLNRHGQKKLSGDGRSPYGLDGQPVFEDNVAMTKDGELIDPTADPNRRADVASTSSARPLFANGKPMVARDGAKLYPNGSKKYSGDGLGYSPFDKKESSADEGEKTELVEELYPNGKPAYDAEGKRLYANGMPRSNDEGVFLYKNGRPMVDESQDRALTPSGDEVVGTRGFQGRAQGQFPIYQIVTGKIVRLDGTQVVVRPQGSSEDIVIDSGKAFVAREANRTLAPGAFSQLVPQLSITAVTRADTTFVDGDLVDQGAPTAVALYASNPRVGSAVSDGQQEEVFVTEGSVRGFDEGKLVLRDRASGSEQQFEVSSAILQKERGDRVVPSDIRSIRVGAPARIVGRRLVEYKKGKPVAVGDATALAVIQE